jgi:hypothetical protein
MPTEIDINGLEEALSLERFSRYLAWAGGDREAAVRLYTVNTRLSESLYTPMQTLEIALRNRIHRVLSEAYHPEWFNEPAFQGGRQLEQLDKAKKDLAEAKKPLEAPRVVAALTFGYWTALFGKEYEDLWRKTLQKIAARPDGRRLGRKDFSTPLTPIRILRNRIAHHEPILHWNLPKHHSKMLELVEWLSPAAATWCRAESRFDAVYPAEGIVVRDVAEPA